MAKLRKWCAYRTMDRPYTRFSKVRKKQFVKSRPGKKVIKFDMGDLKNGSAQFTYKLSLISKDMRQIRTNAIEAARIVTLRPVESKLGRAGFYFRIKCVPHQAIRENPLAAGAGADRLSTGMKHSFGKIIATAARIQEGDTLMELYVPEGQEDLARDALKRASKKLPVRTRIESVKRKVRELTAEELEIKAKEEEKMRLQAEAKAVAAAEKAEKVAAKEGAKEE